MYMVINSLNIGRGRIISHTRNRKAIKKKVKKQSGNLAIQAMQSTSLNMNLP